MQFIKGIVAAVVALALFSLPTHAQQDSVTLSFSITVAGTPCANSTYFAVIGIPDSEFYGVQLSDGDGDRVYTGTTTVAAGSPIRVQLVQGTGTIQSPTSSNPFPGTPITVLRDFGDVTPTADQTFTANAAACATLPGTGAEAGQPWMWGLAALVVLATGTYLHRRMGQYT